MKCKTSYQCAIFKKKNGKPIMSDLGFYIDQLRKMSTGWLSHEEIEGIFAAIKRYERAILAIFYSRDGFFADLNEIREKFAGQEKEQRALIVRISKKPLFRNSEKEQEISRVKVILEEICTREHAHLPCLDMQVLFEKLPFNTKDYVGCIDYLDRMIKRIEAGERGEKRARLAAALEKYSGEAYRDLCAVFKFLDRVMALDLETEYYYQKSLLELKKSIGANDLILKGIQRSKRYEDEISRLLNHFSEHYLRYVVFIASKYRHESVSLSDIIQEGNIGLLKAARKYNHALGHQFMTYAIWWIRQGITKAICDQSRTIKIPVYIHQEYRNIKKVVQQMDKEPGMDADLASISAETGKSEKQLGTLFEMFKYPLSLQQEKSRESDRCLGAAIPDMNAIDPALIVEDANLRDEIYYHLNSLSQREAILIEMRYGLKDGVEYTLDEVAAKFQVTRERVRQIETKALKRLRENGEKRLKPFLAHPFPT